MDKEKLTGILKERYMIEDAGSEVLRECGGQVYIINADKKYLLKIFGQAFSDNARKSAEVMGYLAANDFPVPKTIPNKDGEPIQTIIADGDEQLIVLYEFIEGEEPDLENDAKKVGALVGRFHALMEKYGENTEIHDKHYFIDKYVGFLEAKKSPQAQAFKELGERLWEKVKGLPAGNCHGDLHRGNLLETKDGQLRLIDLDTVAKTPFMFDISVMCDMTNYFQLKEEDIGITRKVYEQFMRGYGEYRSVSEEEINSFPYWVAVRHFQLQAVMMEIYGVNCNDERFDEYQLFWLKSWMDANGIS